MAKTRTKSSDAGAQPGTSDPERRAEILRAAERLLRHYGFTKTTVADIAREANVGVGTVYLEFPSKGAIVTELSRKRYACVLDAMRRATLGDGPAGDRLTAMFDARLHHLGKFARQGQHGMDLVQCSCPATREAHETFRSDEEELLAEFLARASVAGQFDVPQPRRTARVLLRLYESYSVAIMAGSPRSELAAELTIAHGLTLRGLLPRT